MIEPIKFTEEQLQAHWDQVEASWREAFKKVPCACPNCPLTQGDHQ